MAATGDTEIQDGTKPTRGRVLSARFQSFLIIQMLMISSGEQNRDAPARGPGKGFSPTGQPVPSSLEPSGLSRPRAGGIPRFPTALAAGIPCPEIWVN